MCICVVVMVTIPINKTPTQSKPQSISDSTDGRAMVLREESLSLEKKACHYMSHDPTTTTTTAAAAAATRPVFAAIGVAT